MHARCLRGRSSTASTCEAALGFARLHLCPHPDLTITPGQLRLGPSFEDALMVLTPKLHVHLKVALAPSHLCRDLQSARRILLERGVPDHQVPRDLAHLGAVRLPDPPH